MELVNVIKFDGLGTECGECRVDGSQGQTRCGRCGKPLVERPWIVYKFPSEKLLLGSQLIVNNSQEAIFFRGGTALDVFGPGTHTLTSFNLPLLEKVVNLPFGGNTPFTAEVYFVNKVSRLNLKWGTKNPIQLTDPRYRIIVNLRSYGQFGIKIDNSRSFVLQLIGAITGGQVADYQLVSDYFKAMINTMVKDTIADLVIHEKVSVLDITASLDILSDKCRERLTDYFGGFGVQLVNFFIESISIPEEDIAELKKILEQRAQFEILGDDRYTRKRSFDVLEKAADNEGPAGAAIGAGLGLGIGFGAGSAAGGAMADAARQIRISPRETKTDRQKCSSCGFDIPEGAKFCGKCGQKVLTGSIACPACKMSNMQGSRFCSNCGASLESKVCPGCKGENLPEAKFCINCGTGLEG